MKTYKYDKTLLIVGGIFAAVGAIIFLCGIFSAINSVRLRSVCDTAEAVIADIDVRRVYRNGEHRTHRDVFVEYRVDGIKYYNLLPYYTAGMSKGDKVTVYFNPENPDNLKNTSIAINLVLVLFGIVFSFPAIFILNRERKNKLYINRLIAEDRYLLGDDYREEASGVTVNNVRYKLLVVICHDENGLEYEFKSHPYKPGHAPFKEGEPVRVYVDTQNPKRYYVCEE